jgi:hypothetical protein
VNSLALEIPLQTDATNRTTLATTVENLQVSSLPNGLELQSDLVTALQASATSDQSYAAWALTPAMRVTGTMPDSVTAAMM